MNKSLVIGTIVGVVGLFALGGFLLWQMQAGPNQVWPMPAAEQQTPPPAPAPSLQPQNEELDTSTWQTYRNDEYGFEMQLPNEWEPYQDKRNDDGTFYLILNTIPNRPFGDNLLYSISTRIVDENESLNTWFEREAKFSDATLKNMISTTNEVYGEGFLNIEDFSASVEDTKVDKLPAKVQSVRCLKDEPLLNCYFFGTPQNSKAYFIKRGNIMFAFTVITMAPDTNFSKLDQILSTFWFVEDGDIALAEILEWIESYNDPYIPSEISSTTTLYGDSVAYGDLNDDGKDDGVAILTTWAGGTGHFRDLAVLLNENGKPRYLTGTDLGDRSIIHSVKIQSKDIIIEWQDRVSPDIVVRRFRLQDNQLIEI